MDRQRTKNHSFLWGISLLLVWFASSCGGAENDPASPLTIEVWVHSGQEAERETIIDQVARFNRSQRRIRVRLEVLPEQGYNAQVQAAALADDLPDVVEFDGPYVSNYAWQGKLVPLRGLLSDDLLDQLLPSVLRQGSYRDRLYAVGTFDSGLGLYGRRSLLEQAGARIPGSAGEAWSISEFDTLLAALASQDRDGRVLDLKLNYTGEWYSYGFSPALQSAGGDLISRPSFDAARGALNGPAAVRAMTAIQSWFSNERVDPNLDDAAFTTGRVALSWAGHWEFERYREKWGNDLVVLPLPDFGTGSHSGQGSWVWGIAQNSAHPKAAARFISFLLQKDEVLRMTSVNGAVPATRSAVAASRRYGPQGPLRLFADQLTSGVTVPRPETPAYPVISSVFEQAFHDIRNGADVQQTLDRAAAIIDRDIADNQGYPWLERP